MDLDKALVNKYLKDVFAMEEIPQDSSYWQVLNTTTQNSLTINASNVTMLPLAVACVYVILENEGQEKKLVESSISIGNMSVSNAGFGVEVGKAYTLLTQHGFINKPFVNTVTREPTC